MSRDGKDGAKTEPDGADVSRRSFLLKSLHGAAMIASGALAAAAGLAPGLAEARQKVSKAEAHYRFYPNRGRQCSGCVNYRFPFGCRVVQGPVSFHGWCRFYRARA